LSRSRILLADDHKLLLEAFKNLLEPEFEIVGTCSDGREVLAAALELKPDVLVLDIWMPLLNGIDAGRQLKQLLPRTKLIYLTVNQDPDLAAEAFRIGASGYVLKNCAASELVTAINDAICGRSYVTPLITKGMVGSFLQDHKRPRRAHDLTPRQREVLQLLAEGRSMKEVASILRITPRTVAFHKYEMMHQLQIGTSAELIRFAVQEHLVESQEQRPQTD
jgi:DNA-binding NarL/FixJ family response regulator